MLTTRNPITPYDNSPISARWAGSPDASTITEGVAMALGAEMEH